MSRVLSLSTCSAAVVAAVLSAASARAENFADPSAAGYWSEYWTNSASQSTAADTSKVSISGGHLTATVPTDASSNSLTTGNAGPETVSYVRTRTDLPGASSYYGGTLLGNLTGKTGLTATFNLNNSTLTAGAPITGVVGDTYNVPNNAGIRLYFYSDANTLGWYSKTVAYALQMSNGVDVTLTTDLTDPTQWTNTNGQGGVANDPTFATSLADVTRVGLALGSGNFYSNGFAFNTGGSAAVQLDAINTVATPEPASLGVLGLGAVGLLLRRRRM
jgi:hypothetical protein